MAHETDLCFDDLLDATFQAVLCSVLVHNEQFLARARAVIDPNYFAAVVYRAICQGIFAHWDSYGRVPPINALKIEVSKLTEEREIRDAWMQVIDQLYAMPEEEREPSFVATELINFAQRAQALLAIRDAWNNVRQFNISELHQQLDGILKLRAIFEDLGCSLRIDYPLAYAEERREIFKTGLAELDKAMRHGMREGELISIVAPSKKGKSLVLMNMGAGLMLMGYNVVHYTLEMQHLDVLKRYVSILSGVPTNYLDEHVNTVRQCMEMLELVTDKTVIIKEFPARAIEMTAIEGHYNLCREHGDLLVPIIDYADLIRGPRSNDPEWREVHETYLQLRNLGREYGVPVLTASQTNVGGMEAESIEQWHLAGSTRKGFTSDYVWGLNQSKSDYKVGRFRLVPFLNRHSRKDHVVFYQTNYKTGRMKEVTEKKWKELSQNLAGEEPGDEKPYIDEDETPGNRSGPTALQS